jgi:hypothetical protein
MGIIYLPPTGLNIEGEGAADSNGGADAPEVVVSPAMIEAGLGWLYAYDPEITDGRDIVIGIIRAAAKASPSLPDH